jgi:hypothetical protein
MCLFFLGSIHHYFKWDGRKMKILESGELYTFYASASDTVKITCPKCGLAKIFDAGEFRAPYRGIKAKCSCGNIFRCTVEFRCYYRKAVNLSGTFLNKATGYEGVLSIESISLGGMDFSNLSPEVNINNDDMLDVSFYLDDDNNTFVQREVRVKSVDSETIRAVFLQTQSYDKELGFYLLP